jgi:hypothetical protein
MWAPKVEVVEPSPLIVLPPPMRVTLLKSDIYEIDRALGGLEEAAGLGVMGEECVAEASARA